MVGTPKIKKDCKNWWDSIEVLGWEGFKVMEKLKRMKDSIKIWNKEVFGDTKEIKREIIEKIHWLDKKEEENTIEDEEVIERRTLTNKLAEVVFKDVVAWKQKMKLRWIKEWDSNSRLLHILVNNRRNKTLSLDWREKMVQFWRTTKRLKEIMSFYNTLFKEHNEITWSLQGLRWDAITREKAEWLERKFEVEEIREAVFSCDRDKSPRSDRYTMAFYQDCWDIISEDLVRFFE